MNEMILIMSVAASAIFSLMYIAIKIDGREFSPVNLTAMIPLVILGIWLTLAETNTTPIISDKIQKPTLINGGQYVEGYPNGSFNKGVVNITQKLGVVVGEHQGVRIIERSQWSYGVWCIAPDVTYEVVNDQKGTK